MKRNKKGVIPEITREIYKGVKKFDRQQFTEFCTDLYNYGVEDGKNSVPGIDIKSILDVVASVKGIGPKKMEEIKEKLDDMFNQEVQNG